MYSVDGTTILSPSDLTAFLECDHLTRLELEVAGGVRARPEQHDPELEVIRKRGFQHEARELERLVAEGRSVVEIEHPSSSPDELRAAEAETLRAMQAGVEVVFQATFFDGRWRGHADFLIRVDTPSDLGGWSYEVADTKLARRAKPAALLQLCAYAEQVARLQGLWPHEVEVVTGDGGRSRHRIADVVAYYRAAKSRLEAFVEAFVEETPAATYPDPVDHCRVCPWSPQCEERRRRDDHLSLVARMRRDMVVKLGRVGVSTVVDLAARADGEPVPRIGQPTLDRLVAQARLQVAARGGGQILHELLPPDGDERGLAALPAPSPGDVFFDLEGDPWVDGGGIEYLFGFVGRTGNDAAYRCFWGHTPDQEKAAFEGFIDFVTDRLALDPHLHVYHFAPYEQTALKRLMGRYATREAEVDSLLRGKVFVDLYKVVRESVRLSTEGYGLKKIEPLYLPPRHEAVSDGGSSIAVYEDWLETGDGALLESLRSYNEVDCRSTEGLRDWLEDRRIELAASGLEPVERPERPEPAPNERVAAEEAEAAELVARLTHDVPEDRARRTAEQQGRWLLAALVGWHRREAKPEYWAMYDRLGRSDADLVNDSESIGELTYEGVVGEVARSLVHRYRFDPAQEHKMRVGGRPVDPATKKDLNQIVALEPITGKIDLKRGRSSEAAHPRSLIPGWPVNDDVVRAALGRVAHWVADHGIDGPGPYRAVRDLLLERPPRILGGVPGAALAGEHERPLDAARRLVAALDDTCLAVQGPPGSGKTWTGSWLILDLVLQGKRVGVTASSHAAIGNLLDGVCKRAGEEAKSVQVLQRSSDDDRCADAVVRCATTNGAVDQALAEGTADVVAGTKWLFSRPELADKLDVLVVDEAGQLSLADLVAVSGSAKNLVLLGDPQQLAQPSKGTHPGGAEASALEHVLAGRATMPPDRGLFLSTSFRMHPAVCGFVSELAYDGRLESDPSTEKQTVAAGPIVEGSGLRFIGVESEGNRTRSHEEAERVAEVVHALTGRAYTDERGQQGWLTLDHILVIAPFNAQVAALAEVLPAGAQVGTVDRFQGQEAPVVIYSMGASSADDVPRGIEFLYSRNRTNVAVSRARALAVLVASPALLEARCRTVGQVALVNGLCRFVELAAAR